MNQIFSLRAHDLVRVFGGDYVEICNRDDRLVGWRFALRGRSFAIAAVLLFYGGRMFARTWSPLSLA
jgi:hypothetical protein